MTVLSVCFSKVDTREVLSVFHKNRSDSKCKKKKKKKSRKTKNPHFSASSSSFYPVNPHTLLCMSTFIFTFHRPVAVDPRPIHHHPHPCTGLCCPSVASLQKQLTIPFRKKLMLCELLQKMNCDEKRWFVEVNTKWRNISNCTKPIFGHKIADLLCAHPDRTYSIGLEPGYNVYSILTTWTLI